MQKPIGGRLKRLWCCDKNGDSVPLTSQTLKKQRKRFKQNASKACMKGLRQMRKTSLFEFDVPSYRKRAVGLTENNKHSR
jgi:hypothetical protein